MSVIITPNQPSNDHVHIFKAHRTTSFGIEEYFRSSDVRIALAYLQCSNMAQSASPPAVRRRLLPPFCKTRLGSNSSIRTNVFLEQVTITPPCGRCRHAVCSVTDTKIHMYRSVDLGSFVRSMPPPAQSFSQASDLKHPKNLIVKFKALAVHRR